MAEDVARDHPDADLLAAWATYRDEKREESECLDALEVLTGRPATTWRGAEAQVEALAFLLGADDPDPDDPARLVALLRDALPRLAGDGEGRA